ncbi:hypothetical protein NDU88_005605 [Pleurodeles waltl]|uniref:Uncharacterized protein n=1 Tax=Pleurodeles waltl TaxID=8319 RepID=A0AAV7TX24_PLEWA|nr:hypothetical protein NDU88_005605 [Pleurodeles waltl]
MCWHTRWQRRPAVQENARCKSCTKSQRREVSTSASPLGTPEGGRLLWSVGAGLIFCGEQRGTRQRHGEETACKALVGPERWVFTPPVPEMTGGAREEVRRTLASLWMEVPKRRGIAGRDLEEEGTRCGCSRHLSVGLPAHWSVPEEK